MAILRGGRRIGNYDIRVGLPRDRSLVDVEKDPRLKRQPGGSGQIQRFQSQINQGEGFAAPNRYLIVIHPPERLVLEMTFIPPDKRSYDRDNLVARMKAGIDGLADALRINDKRFNTVISTMDSDYPGGFVKIRILQEIPYGKKDQKPISQDTRIQR